MKYKEIDNPVWQPVLILIEALAKVELLEKELKNTDYTVTGIGISSKSFEHEKSTVNDNILKRFSDATGIEIQYVSGGNKKEITFYVEQKNN